MRHGSLLLLLCSIMLATGCASSRATTGRSSVDYGSYNEDLAAVRPIYKPASATSATTNKPVSPPNSATSSAANSTRKPETRKPTEALHVNRQLDLVMDTIATQNRLVRYAPGFRIQVYVGNQRQEVESIKLLIYQNFPELSPYLTYNQPTYKLKVGDFMRRIDAERYFASIKQLIASSQLQPDKVDIRRSLSIK